MKKNKHSQLRVGILTFHYARNYGAIIQTYALQEYLKSSGYKVEIIDYVPSRRIYGIKLLNLRYLAALVIKAIKKLLEKLRKKNLVVDKKYNLEFFREFNRKFFNMTEFKELKENISKYSAIIVGSDQVWAIDPYFYGATYLLDWVPEDVAKISYAASFGKAEIPNIYRDVIKKNLYRFQAISVRERSGVKILNSMGIDSKLVCDPTVLHTDFSSLIHANDLTEDYLFVYHLSQNDSMSEQFWNIVSEIMEIKNIKVIIIGDASDVFYNKDSVQIFEEGVGVEQFLSFIHHANFVITNSFHGTVLASKFKRDMIVLSRDGKSDGQDTRMIEYLAEIGLSERFVKKREDIPHILNSNIDFLSVDLALSRMRNHADSYIREALLLHCSH